MMFMNKKPTISNYIIGVFLNGKNQSDFWVREVKAENKWGKSSELKVRLAIDSGAIILVDMCSWKVARKLGLSVVSVNWSDGWL